MQTSDAPLMLSVSGARGIVGKTMTPEVAAAYGGAFGSFLKATTGTLNNGGARIDRYFDAENYLDLAATWQVMDTVTLRAGVNNVLDNDPQLSYSVGTTGNGNTYPQVYDSLGRYFFVGVTANF